MNKNLIPLLMVAIIAVCAVVVFACATGILDFLINAASDLFMGSLILESAYYSESTETLTIYLQCKADSLNSADIKDFEWYINDQNKGSVYSVTPTNKENMKVMEGEIIEITVKIEKIPPDAKITLIHKSGFKIVVKEKEIIRN
jgi:membrane-bound ClpP family serine protease